MKTIGSIIAFSLLLLSCKRPGTINGRVVSAYDGKPVSGIKLNLEGVNSGLFSSKSYQRLDGAVSDENGYFSFDYKFQNNKRSYFSISTDDPVTYVIDTSAAVYEKYFVNPDPNCTSCSSSISGEADELKNATIKLVPSCRFKISERRLSNTYNNLSVVVYNEYFRATLFSNNYYYYLGNLYFDNYALVPTTGKLYISWSANNWGANYNLGNDTIEALPFGKYSYQVTW